MRGVEPRFVWLHETRSPERVPAIEAALEREKIPYRTGLQVGPQPSIVFTVAERHLDTAKAIVAHVLEPFEDDDAEAAWEAAREAEARERERATFPSGPIAAAATLVFVHLVIVLAFVGADPTRERLTALGGLVRTGDAFEIWRLLTSLFLHSDVRHVLGNGLSLVAFAVPAIVTWGYARSGVLYLLCGVGGGLAALEAHPAGTVIVGSSGAVAGLFGAWLIATARRARNAPMTRRAWIRTIGVGFLVLPSLVNPVTSEGRPISVAAHLGGLATGVVLGLLLDVWQERGEQGMGAM